MEFFRRRRDTDQDDQDFLALEDGRIQEDRLIGQELVPANGPRRVEMTGAGEEEVLEVARVGADALQGHLRVATTGGTWSLGDGAGRHVGSYILRLVAHG